VLEIVSWLKFSARRWPAVPANVRSALRPGVSNVSVCGVPGTSVPVRSGGDWNRFSVRPPVFDEDGSTYTVYVPVTGSATGPRMPPVVLIVPEAMLMLPGFLIEIVDCVIESSVTVSVTFWPAVPANVKAPFWPGAANTSGVGPLSIGSVPVWSAATSYSENVRSPMFAPGGLIEIVYVPVTGSVTGSM
jgi:hypothetical protein